MTPHLPTHLDPPFPSCLLHVHQTGLPGNPTARFCVNFCGWHSFVTVNNKLVKFTFTANAGKTVRQELALCFVLASLTYFPTPLPIFPLPSYPWELL